jgi:hypothetical protein
LQPEQENDMTALDFLPVEPAWMLLDVRYHDTENGCDLCGTPHRRVFLVEESATGRQLRVGKNCYQRLAAQKPHQHDMVEAELSDCPYGCKVHRCPCGEEQAQHMASYGCPTGRRELTTA